MSGCWCEVVGVRFSVCHAVCVRFSVCQVFCVSGVCVRCVRLSGEVFCVYNLY